MNPREGGDSQRAGSEHDGRSVLDALAAVLRRCEEAEVQLDSPGEGGERTFRHRLATDLLTPVLGWASDRVVISERFDVRLRDDLGYPVATIETKAPRLQASKAEREAFEGRLSAFGTLRHAFLTNGPEWQRLDVAFPGGELSIHARFHLDVSTATVEEADAFFAPLRADRYCGGVSRPGKLEVRRDHPHVLGALAADFDETIRDLSSLLASVFFSYLEGKAGAGTKGYTVNLFDLWCTKSLLVSPKQAGERLAAVLRKEGANRRDVTNAVKELGFSEAEAPSVTDTLATLPAKDRSDAAAITDALWPHYGAAVEKLCAQTAHVILARALLYRACEDRAGFPRTLSGEGMVEAISTPPSPVVDAPKPATALLAQVQTSMQNVLPTVYDDGEFDWWKVMSENRPKLTAGERAWLRQQDERLERANQRMLRVLNGYAFSQVDVDVWRNVYQNYLPADERQRLGGFYTPDEMVELVLDLAEYTPERRGLCEITYLDPACGSGAFVATALARLLKHLDLDLPCHEPINKKGIAPWKRAEEILKIAAANVHAVDVHPFAAFLTTINALFLVMPLYAKAREKNPDFTIDLEIFSSDSLEKHDEDLFDRDLFTTLNSRAQLSVDSFKRYQRMLKRKFDFVCGNPPWGGVLKGPLAPIYDETKKGRFKREYPEAARGKYDIYGLFIERAIRILHANGRLALVTPSSFIDKDWAAGLRSFLASKARPRYIIDLNPFGQLFFHAMNTPCVTVVDAIRDAEGNEQCLTVLSRPPTTFTGLAEDERRRLVAATVKDALNRFVARKRPDSEGFATASRVSLKRLRDTAKDRWDLSGSAPAVVANKEWLNVADVLEPSQGVTPGGKGCLGLFLMSCAEAERLGLERELIHPVVKSLEVQRWGFPRPENVLLYPYKVTARGARPAFVFGRAGLSQELRKTLSQRGVVDGLDFDKAIDTTEQAIARKKGVNRETVGELLKHRIALGLVAYPVAAGYLANHFEELEGRVLKKRNIREFNRYWYEFAWRRDPGIMLARPKIIAPRLTRVVRFAVDARGVIPQDSCIALLPGEKTEVGYRLLSDKLGKALGRDAGLDDVLNYCLAFLNSDYAQQRLVAGRRPTPKGHFAITDGYLREIPLPTPGEDAKTVIEHVSKLANRREGQAQSHLEQRLNAVVSRLLSG